MRWPWRKREPAPSLPVELLGRRVVCGPDRDCPLCEKRRAALARVERTLSSGRGGGS